MIPIIPSDLQLHTRSHRYLSEAGLNRKDDLSLPFSRRNAALYLSRGLACRRRRACENATRSRTRSYRPVSFTREREKSQDRERERERMGRDDLFSRLVKLHRWKSDRKDAAINFSFDLTEASRGARFARFSSR